MVISLASNSKGTGILSGHDDGSILRYVIDDHGELSGKIVMHPVPPSVLAWSHNFVCASGCDKKIVFYDLQVSFGPYSLN